MLNIGADYKVQPLLDLVRDVLNPRSQLYKDMLDIRCACAYRHQVIGIQAIVKGSVASLVKEYRKMAQVSVGAASTSSIKA